MRLAVVGRVAGILVIHLDLDHAPGMALPSGLLRPGEDGLHLLVVGGETAGIAAPIEAEGAVVLIAKNFRAMLDTYKRTPELSFEGGANGLKINNLRMPIQKWIANPIVAER